MKKKDTPEWPDRDDDADPQTLDTRDWTDDEGDLCLN